MNLLGVEFEKLFLEEYKIRDGKSIESQNVCVQLYW